MPIQFKASASVDINIEDAARLQELYPYLYGPNSSLQGIIDTLVINGSSNNNLSVSLAPSMVHDPTQYPCPNPYPSPYPCDPCDPFPQSVESVETHESEFVEPSPEFVEPSPEFVEPSTDPSIDAQELLGRHNIVGLNSFIKVLN